MKLRNKKTGEIVEFLPGCIYNSIAELKEDWEDYEESKEYWFIDYDGGIIPFSKMKDTPTDKSMKQIGNYFETREEAEMAVEKLKAWKRLKDKGFEFKDWCLTEARFEIKNKDEHIYKDLAIIFGDE